MRYSWMDIAERQRGVKEIAGASAHPQIVEYHSTTTLKATSDEVPWCSSFVNWVMKAAKYPYTKSAAARSWRDYGVETQLKEGAIVVFRRKGGHHVGFCVGETSTMIRVLGGNQSNEVNVRNYRKADLIAVRIPARLNKTDQSLWEIRIAGQANDATKGLI